MIYLPVTGFALFEAALVGAIVLQVFRLLQGTRIPKGTRLPPGPPRKPIVGNILQMPSEFAWIKLAQWSKEYGDLVYLSGFRSSILIINSQKIANELLDKRSSIYSDRPRQVMLQELMGWDRILALMHYNEKWRKHRKMIHQKFHPTVGPEFWPRQLESARGLLLQLYESPDRFFYHLQQFSAAVIMEIVYGIKVLPEEDPYLSAAKKTLIGLTEVGLPGGFLVDVFPILKYVPEWFPGAEFKRKARVWRKHMDDMNWLPFNFVKQALNSGTAEPSFIASLLEALYEKGTPSPEQEAIIRNSGATLFSGGADTTVYAFHTFFLAMVLYPEAQRKAQEELDKVVGPDRLPNFEDRENLPYIKALCQEVLRWHPVAPVGVPHLLTQDDVYEDYFIPAGTTVLANIWTHNRNEAMYGPETNEFRPERFLAPGMKPPDATFGFGRRICPGQFFAEDMLYVTVVSTLSVFDITNKKDSNGNVIPVKASFESGGLSRPSPFQCAISPRSEKAKQIILQDN